ncbi:hypothetical protein DY000_02043475 [Brassica cretica]|uniref:Uncharacterized protein n=1 Tax=Brassica cretica TaxID=69181 RepID=A0ABQ7BRE6_BRACR|nr:hypothetical protein DY000_02043475 [Brassica cretica]
MRVSLLDSMRSELSHGGICTRGCLRVELATTHFPLSPTETNMCLERGRLPTRAPPPSSGRLRSAWAWAWAWVLGLGSWVLGLGSWVLVEGLRPDKNILFRPS